MDDTFQTTFSNVFSLMRIADFFKMSLKSVPKVPINNIQTLVQIMAWRRSGDKPFSESILA